MIPNTNRYPKIGENIENFIDVFGQPASGSRGISYMFDVEGVTARLLCSVLDGQVYNISWSLSCDLEKVKEVALGFLPTTAVLIEEGAFEIRPELNGDVPTSCDLYRIRDNNKEIFVDFMIGKDSTFTIDLSDQKI